MLRRRDAKIDTIFASANFVVSKEWHEVERREVKIEVRCECDGHSGLPNVSRSSALEKAYYAPRSPSLHPEPTDFQPSSDPQCKPKRYKDPRNTRGHAAGGLLVYARQWGVLASRLPAAHAPQAGRRQTATCQATKRARQGYLDFEDYGTDAFLM